MLLEPDKWFLARSTFGELNSVLIAPRNKKPAALVVLCHGYGASGIDLVGCGEELLGYMPDSDALPAFLFPEAPVDLEDEGIYGGRAWWRLNMAKLLELNATNSFELIRNEIPDGIDEARVKLSQAIYGCVTEHHWEPVPVILGGFSQGAMLSTDTCLRGDVANVRGLILWSGALICEQAWKEAHAANQRILPVLQSHGTVDPILPITTGRLLNQLLNQLMPSVPLIEFHGPHTIPTEAIQGAASLISQVCNQSAAASA